jgi:hypothetical protein
MRLSGDRDTAANVLTCAVAAFIVAAVIAWIRAQSTEAADRDGR